MSICILPALYSITTSIRRPLVNATFKAQAGRRFPSLFFPANSTVTNRLLTVALSSPRALASPFSRRRLLRWRCKVPSAKL